MTIGTNGQPLVLDQEAIWIKQRYDVTFGDETVLTCRRCGVRLPFAQGYHPNDMKRQAEEHWNGHLQGRS